MVKTKVFDLLSIIITMFCDEKIKIWQSRLVKPEYAEIHDKETIAGRIVGVSAQGLLCQTRDGILEILEMQPAGKNRMSGRAFYNGRACLLGKCFG